MSSEGGRPDGSIDFTGYSTDQLRDLECTLDRHNRPQDLAHLQAELQRRDGLGAGPQAGIDVGPWPIELTREAGLWGWLRAKARRLPLYGQGSLELGPDQIVLRGWQRTWLGMPLQADLPIPRAQIRNVAQDERLVRFDARRGRGRRRRRYAFRMASADLAARVVSLLPAAQTPGFSAQWQEQREFDHRLRAQGAPRVTEALVAINVLVFIAMALAARRVSGFGLQELERWGADNGPLVMAGQWWRLLTAAFLHFSPLHLLINMWVFWNVGRLTERLFGRWTYLALYLGTAVLASLGSIAWNPILIGVGASGAIFGIFGAFLAYLAKRRTRVPGTVVRAHWLSTLVFVLFSLISGALQAGIDNGAHVGGLIAGFCLGWILARPLESVGRPALSLPQVGSAGAVALALTLAALWEVGGIGSRLTATQRYFQSHLWYVDGEARDLALWRRLIVEDQSGLVSNEFVSEQFESKIVPFWQSAAARLGSERPPVSQRQLAALVLKFVRLRLAWAQAVVTTAANDNSQNERRAVALSNQTNLALARVLRFGMLDAARGHLPGLINSPFMQWLRQLVLADRWRCVAPPASWATPLGPRDKRTDLPAASRRVACTAQRDFVHRDFSGLENLLQARTPLADLPAGGSTYAAAVSGLTDLMEFGGMSIQQVLHLTAEWRRQRPSSPLPTLIEAMGFESWAWVARGSGYANSVTAPGWLWYEARVEMAATSLREAPASAGATPLWYQLSLRVGIDQSKTLAKLRGIFAAGATRFPDYLPLYRQMLRALMPRWLGSYREVDQFINAEYAQTAPRIGFQLYTRLYWAFATLSGDKVDIFTDGDADWRSMKSGFQELEARYPASDYLLNAFANFACRAGDKTEYANLRPQVLSRFSATAWSGEFTVAACDRRLQVQTKGSPAPLRAASR